MSERGQLVVLAAAREMSLSAICGAFGVSRKTGYKWLNRLTTAGVAGLTDRSRRPLHSPRLTSAAVEAEICELRRQHPAWGGRKLHHVLRAEGLAGVPAPSTITDILARHDLLSSNRRLQRDHQRFEAEAPNDLWQMDFKGHFATQAARCHPLTILDDHSRFNICLTACANEQAETVHTQLRRAFERYGLPARMLMDNGSPWGSEQAHPHTRLTAWLIRQGITVSHGRPYHPQTQGKEERFHRTLKAEVLSLRPIWRDLDEAQSAFDAWRPVYNLRRPHEALANRPPASRYKPSRRRFEKTLPAIEYKQGDQVRQVQDKGRISFRGRTFLVSRAFIGEPVALRASDEGIWEVYYCHQRVAILDLNAPPHPALKL